MSREQADALAEHEYERFASERRAKLERDAESDTLNELEDEVKKLPTERKPQGPKS